MSRHHFNKGDTVWHGCRYWKQDDLEDNEVSGWNAEYEPYTVMRVTSKRIVVAIPRSGYPEVHLNRQTMERDGVQYHSRFSEYFFAEKPNFIGDYIGRVYEGGVIR